MQQLNPCNGCNTKPFMRQQACIVTFHCLCLKAINGYYINYDNYESDEEAEKKGLNDIIEFWNKYHATT